ncbi:MAG: thermonuclease family protein [Alphaproteobacteria bacterium]|nr:thermonuclease family protein [Alphaproteobacteria bacterium]
MAAAAGIAAAEPLPGSYTARVERVIDGDSLRARVTIWLGQEVTTTIRLAGIDTAELRAACPRAHERAAAAKAFLAAHVEGGTVTLTAVETDKYGGRVVARVQDADGADLANVLVAQGLALPYDGRQRPDWCAIP